MPPPVSFTCTHTTPMAPADIAASILDPDQWTTFKGWGPLPGIAHAEFTRYNDPPPGSTVSVKATDNSTHTETITAWDLPHALAIRMDAFSPPLSRLATHIDESWTFKPAPQTNTHSDRQSQTHIHRRFDIHPTSAPARWFIAIVIRPMLRAAIKRHMRELDAPAN